MRRPIAIAWACGACTGCWHPTEAEAWACIHGHSPRFGADRDPLGEPRLDRLAFDFNVSQDSPCVRGTWVTVAHVVSLILDGRAWSDILRAHPELTRDDIRACLQYTIVKSGGKP